MMSEFKMESRLRSIHFASTSEPIKSPPITNNPRGAVALCRTFAKLIRRISTPAKHAERVVI
jgi:hypothetical protein